MRNIFVIVVALATFMHVQAETFTLADGDTVSGEIRRVEPDGIVLIIDSGISKVKFSNLPREIAEKYGYDPNKAKAFKDSQMAAASASQAELVAKQNWEEKKSQCKEITVWGFRNEFKGALVFPSRTVGAGAVTSSLGSVGGGGAGTYFQGIEKPDESKILYIDNLKDLANGSSKKIKAYKDGTITIFNESYEKWVWIPDGF